MSRSDKELLDFLQSLNDRSRYTGKSILRDSSTGRGWRLHETDKPGGVSDIREAISKRMDEVEGTNGN